MVYGVATRGNKTGEDERQRVRERPVLILRSKAAGSNHPPTDNRLYPRGIARDRRSKIKYSELETEVVNEIDLVI